MLTIVTGNRERPRVDFWLRREMVTSSECMLTIVIPDRERSRLEGIEWAWSHELGWQAHDRDGRSWASQTCLWKEVLQTLDDHELEKHAHDREHPRLERWRMQLGHELKVLAHDRDCRSWASQNEHTEWATYSHELEAHAQDRDMDRERPRKTFWLAILQIPIVMALSWSWCFISRSWW